MCKVIDRKESIEVSTIAKEQLQPQELIGANSVGYMITHTTSHSIGYGIATTTWCNSPKDGDNGHTKTIEEV